MGGYCTLSNIGTISLLLLISFFAYLVEAQYGGGGYGGGGGGYGGGGYGGGGYGGGGYGGGGFGGGFGGGYGGLGLGGFGLGLPIFPFINPYIGLGFGPRNPKYKGNYMYYNGDYDGYIPSTTPAPTTTAAPHNSSGYGYGYG